MKLCILIPAIPERLYKVKRLYAKLEEQITKAYPCHKYSENKDIHILSLCDNMVMSIGAKRNDLKSLIKADYFGFVDDDDDIFPGYIDLILEATESNPDIITFKQKTTLDNKSFTVTFGLDNKNEPVRTNERGNYVNINRKPFHVCIWKTSLVKGIKFPPIQYGEDWKWAKKALKKVKTEVHIDNVIHHYIWDRKKTRAY